MYESWPLRRELSNSLLDHLAGRARRVLIYVRKLATSTWASGFAFGHLKGRWPLVYVCESWPLWRGLPNSLFDHLAERARRALVYVYESRPLRRELSFSVWPHNYLVTWSYCLWASRCNARSVYVKAGHFNVGFHSLFDHCLATWSFSHVVLLFVSIAMRCSICVCERNALLLLCRWDCSALLTSIACRRFVASTSYR